MSFEPRMAYLGILGVLALGASPAMGQSKEDLLSGAPLDTQVVVSAVGSASVSQALAACGKGKLSAGTANLDLSVSPAGKATLIATNPVLPADVGACLAGVIASMSLPTSGTGATVTIAFAFPASPPPSPIYSSKTNPAYDPAVQKVARVRRAGIGLMIPGLIVSALGIICLGAVFGSGGDDTGVAVGTGLTVGGAMLWIPGAIITGIYTKRVNAAIAAAAVAAIPSPGLAFDPGTGTRSLVLSWRF